MSFKIGICGAQGVGKTTLLNAFIDKHPDWNFVTEVARDCPYLINEETGYEAQKWIMDAQISEEIRKHVDSKNVITDRTTIDQLAYVRRACMHYNMSRANYKYFRKYLDSWAKTYDHILYIPIEFELEADGVRSTCKEFQDEIDNYIQYGLIESGIDYTRLSGSVDERMKQIENWFFYKGYL